MARKKESFTLEKVKIHDRLHKVEIQLAELNTNVKNHVEMDTQIHEDLKSMFQAHRDLMFGNGDSIGLKTKIDRIEQTEKNRSINMKIIWASITGLAGKIIYDLFSGKGS